ncbi:MAG: glycosyl hydrolase, partial [Opitutales bacterium]
EVGAQNWTDGFIQEFERRNGYSPLAFLPIFTGRMIESAQASDQFLWDLRRTVSDMISENYVGGLREIAHENGLVLWCENYGHWGFPGDFLSYGGQSDQVGGEFWTRPASRGTIECRAASSAANIYGKRRVFAEAFTSKLNFGDHPYSIKARGEQIFAEGINHFVLHVYAHQPRDGVPGNNPWFGTAFHRNTPWFNLAHGWVRYLQRSHLMLQLGEPAADVLVYIGDFAPQMTGPGDPVPAGYDYDYIGSDAILRTLHVVDGEWVVYDENEPGQIFARWKLLAMPKEMHLRPEVAKRLAALRREGGAMIETVKVSPKILQQADIEPAFSDASFGVRCKERRLGDGRLFFLSNFQKTGAFQLSLRVSGKQPELFNPVTGEVKKLAHFKSEGERTRIFLDVKDRSDAFFLVFRDALPAKHVVKTTASSADVDLYFDPRGQLIAESAVAGRHSIEFSDGSRQEILFEASAPGLELKGPWETLTPVENEFTLRQKTTFNLPVAINNNQRIILDLGKVEVMAQVTLNGKKFDTLWMPPFELDVTDALRVGENSLEVELVSTSEGRPTMGDPVTLTALYQKAID